MNVRNDAGTRPGAEAEVKRSLKERAVDELKRYLVISAYLCVLLAVFSLHRQLLLGHEISLWQQGFAIINALVFGKIILLGEALKLGERKQNHALAWTVLRRSLIFSVLLVASQILEESIRAWFQHRHAASVIVDLGGWPGVLCHAVIIFVALLPFFAVQEAGRVLGARALWNLFFRNDGRQVHLAQD